MDIVHARALREPDRVCLVFYDRRDHADPVTYATFSREATAFAAVFAERGLRCGEPVVLIADSVRSFVSAFLGAQQLGLLPVPVPPPDPMDRGRRSRDRLADIIRRSGATGVFSPRREWLTGELASLLQSRRTPAVCPDDIEGTGPVSAPDVPIAAQPFAFCQFTSGSGGRAKGVLVTHDNVLANLRARARAYDLEPTDVSVTWLPFFHDMGLVGSVILALVTGCPCHVVPPLRFLARPAVWLTLISRVRATMSTAPNLAYALCARRISDDQIAGIDLSCWKRAFSGSEPVTREAVEAFIERFRPYGFDPGALLPAYGLAETTLTITSRRPGQGARFDPVSVAALARENRAAAGGDGEPHRMVASVGRPIPDHEVAIVGAGGAFLAERHVGEVAVHGRSVMHGYLPGTGDDCVLRPDGWLLTGDIGYLADGELYLLGRKKDLIIRGGSKYYPEDIEEAVVAALGTGVRRVVAFSVPGPEVERVVIAAELRKDWRGDVGELRAAIERAVFREVRFVPDEVVFVPAGELPLTTSGKVMRPSARQLYLDGAWREDEPRDARGTAESRRSANTAA